MFTGLVEEVGTIGGIVERGGNHRITINAPATAKELQQGNSVAVSGVCLTALDITPQSFCADLAAETWRLTSFSRVTQGALVNLELPLKADGRMGGHMVQGHVDGTGRFVGLEPIVDADDFWLLIDIPENLEKYVVFKGSIAIEGISLTVAKLEGLRLTIAIIPHTVKMTNLASLKPGDPVNIETDIVAKYLEKWTHRDEQSGALTVERLVALAPTPRSDTPCEEGFAKRLLDRRNVLNPGICRSTSSTTRLPDASICSWGMEYSLMGTAGILSPSLDFTSRRCREGAGLRTTCKFSTAERALISIEKLEKPG